MKKAEMAEVIRRHRGEKKVYPKWMWALVAIMGALTALLFSILFVFGPKRVAVDTRAPNSGLDKSTAWQMCTEAAQVRTSHPSTFDAKPWDSTWSDSGEGPASLTTSFVAKNSFGLELKHEVRCLFDGTKMTDIEIGEVG